MCAVYYLDIEEHVSAVVVVGDRAAIVVVALGVRRRVVGLLAAADLETK